MNQKTLRNISPKELFDLLENDSIKLIVIDVREDSELEIASLPFVSFHLPLSKFEDWSKTVMQKLSLEAQIVVICHSGIRSRNFGLWLLEQNDSYDVWNLIGGIDSWSLEIDQSIARY